MSWCEATTCARPLWGRGLCNLHYQRWRKHGEAAIGVRRDPIRPLPEVERLARHRRINDNGCWEWTGATNGVGYGVVTVRNRRLYVHRLSYMLAVGPIPDGLIIDHLCRNTLCFNPDHLEAVTYAENTQRSPLIGQKTTCKMNHSFTTANTYISPAGARRCRECARQRERLYRTRRAVSARRV
jgi:hypothetical protein